MKSPLEAPEKQIAEETSAKPEKPTPAAVIDTSKMVKGQREALESAEAARDPLEDRGSFASNLFVGRYDFNRIYPWPAAERRGSRGWRGISRAIWKSICARHVDADEIDRTGEIPQKNIRGAVAALGAFGVKIPKTIRRARVVSDPIMDGLQMLLGSWDGNVDRARFGAPIDRCSRNPCCLFGTEEQKEKISAARCAKGNFRVRVDRMECRFGPREHE